MIKTLYPNTEIVYFSKLLWKKYIKQPNISMYIEIDHKLVPRKIFDINDWTPLPIEEPEIDSHKESNSDEDSFGPRGFGFDRRRSPTGRRPKIDSDKESDSDEDSFGPRGFGFDRRRRNVNHNVNKEEVQKGDFNSALMYFMEQKEEGGGKWINFN